MAVTSAMHHLLPPQLRSNDESSNDKSNVPQSANQSSHSPRHGDRHQDDQDGMMAHDEEMDFISQWEEDKEPLEPSQITLEPAQKKVGHSSRHLRLDDFELIKTLGTGTHLVSLGQCNRMLTVLTQAHLPEYGSRASIATSRRVTTKSLLSRSCAKRMVHPHSRTDPYRTTHSIDV